MVPAMHQAPPAVIHEQPSDWEKSKDELDGLLQVKGGVGILLSVEVRKRGQLTFRYIERGSSDSAWRLEVLPIDPVTKQPGKGEDISRAGGFIIQVMKPLERIIPMPEGARQLLIRFRTEKFKGMGEELGIPPEGASPRVTILHLPA